MSEWEDYYQILEVDPEASQEEIKRAYRYKAFLLHSDRQEGLSESFRYRAQEDLKKVNRAYAVIGDPQRRRDYHSEWLKKKDTHTVPKPKPVVDPPYIGFRDVKPREVKKASFIIQNIGGSYTKIWISNPDSWVKVLSWASVTSDDELPLRVNIEAEGKNWGQIYSEYIRVKLDEEETEVKVELETKPEPVGQRICTGDISRVKPTSPASPKVASRRGSPISRKRILAPAIIAFVAISIYGIYRISESAIVPRGNPHVKVFKGVNRWAKYNLPRKREVVIPESGYPRNAVNLMKFQVKHSAVVGEHAWVVAYYGLENYYDSRLNPKASLLELFPPTGYILHSLDGGRTWEVNRKIPKFRPSYIKFITETQGCVSGHVGALYTNNGGNHWDFSTFPPEIQGTWSFESTEGQHLVINCTYGNDQTWGLCESFDGGRTWHIKID